MNDIVIYTNRDFGEVRTTQINSEPYFCLSDVCKILNIGNVSQLKTRLEQGGVITSEIGVQTGYKKDGTPAIQKVRATFINESNLYKVIFQSRKPEAEKFTEWVTGEVLPSIRKNSVYATDDFLEKSLSDPDYVINLLQGLKEAKEKERVAKENLKMAEQKVIEANYQEAIAERKSEIISDELKSISGDIKYANALNSEDNCVTWFTMNALINKNRIKPIGKNNFLKELRERGILQKYTYDGMRNVPYGEYVNNKKYFTVNVKPVFDKSGLPVINPKTGKQKTYADVRVTPKGQKFLLKKFCGIKEEEIIWLNDKELREIALQELNYSPEKMI